MDKKDKRMNYTKEALSNIKNLKFYSWTEMFESEIFKRREQELGALKKQFRWIVLLILNIVIWPDVLGSVVMAIFIAFGGSISLSTSITSMIFFQLIRDPLIQAPMIYTSWVQLQVSMKRIQKFLDSDEVDVDKLVNQKDISEKNRFDAVSITNKSFTWGINKKKDEDEDKDEGKKKKSKKEKKASKKGKKSDPMTDKLIETNSAESLESSSSGSAEKKDRSGCQLENIITLKDISINVKHGEFVCVIGDVGSGKSSLLHTLIGDMLYVS